MKRFLLQHTKEDGFTLVELLVSLALFSIVVIAAIGSLYTVNEASQRVNAMRTVLDNLNFATESMSRTIRTGDTIVCGGVESGNVGNGGEANCPLSSTAGSDTIALHSTLDNSWIEYRWRQSSTSSNREIQKCILSDTQNADGSSTIALDPNKCVALTDPNIDITNLVFFVDGADPTDNKQPGVSIFMQGNANAGPNSIQPFAIQTYVSQRAGE